MTDEFSSDLVSSDVNDSEGQNSEDLILTLAKGASISFVGRIFARGFLLIGQALLARALGQSDYGLFSLGWSILQISLYASPIGLPQGIIHYGTASRAKGADDFRRVLQQTIVLSILASVLSGGGLFLLSRPIAALYNDDRLILIVRGMSIVLSLIVILRVIAAATRISHKMQFSVLAEDALPAFLITLGAIILLLFWPAGLSGSVTVLLVTYLVSAVLALAFLFALYPGVLRPVKWQSSLFREIASFSFSASVAGTLTVLLQWTSRLILGYFATNADLGTFQAATQLASLPAIVLTSIGAIFMPMISHLVHSGQKAELNALYKIATKWAFYLTTPMFLVLVIFSAQCLTLFGDEYRSGAIPLVIMAFGQLVNMMSGSVAPLHILHGYQKQWTLILLISFILTVLLNWWWIPLWGLLGAAAATAIGIAVVNIAGVLSIRSLVGLWPYDRRYWKGILVAVVTVPVLLLVRYIQPDGFWQLLIASALAVGIFFLVLWLVGFDAEDQQFIAAVRRRIGI